MSYTPPSTSVVSTVNSSTATLGIGGSFTGTSESVLNYAAIQVYVFADQASATDGLSVQQSSNGTNWDVTDVFTVPASTGKTFSFQPVASFYRVVYTNGGVAQGAFRLQTAYHYSLTKASSVRAMDGVSNENDLEQVASFGMVWNGTTWDRDKGDYVPRNLELSGSISSAGSVIPSTDVTNYKSGYIQVTGTWSGILALQVSNDNVTWVNLFWSYAGSQNTPQSTINSNGLFEGTFGYRYMRFQVTTYTSGTISAVMELSTAPYSRSSTNAVAITGTPSVGITANAAISAGTMYRNQSLTNVAVAVKASSGRVFSIHIINGKVAGSLNATPSYVHLYDVAAASVVVGTTAPVWTYAVPASGAYDDERVIPIVHATAIAIAATTSPDGLTSTAPTNNLVVSGQYA